MTRSELTNLFIRKTELFNSEQLLFSLKESYSVAIESGFSENLERNIFELEQKITREKAAIEQDRETALQTLKLIEDDAGRVGAMLHYPSCPRIPESQALFLHLLFPLQCNYNLREFSCRHVQWNKHRHRVH